MRYDRETSDDDRQEDDKERKVKKVYRTYPVRCSMCFATLQCPESKDGDIFLSEKNRQCVNSTIPSCVLAVKAKSNVGYVAQLKG